PLRLLQRAARELVARYAAREAEVVLNARRCPGLAAGGFALDDDGAQSVARAIDRGSETGRPAADDQRVALVRSGARLQAEQRRELARLRTDQQRAVRQPHRGTAVFGWSRSGPALRKLGRIGRHPVERDLVAPEELPQLGAGAVPAVADHRHARL